LIDRNTYSMADSIDYRF